MARRDARDLYVRTLRAGALDGDRYFDLSVEFVDERDLSPMLSVGGVWDRQEKCWAPDRSPRTALQVKVHPGQIRIVEWWSTWIEAYMRGEDLDPAIYSALVIGGSRSGKTYVGLRLMVAFAIAVPGSRIWAVQEVDADRSEELETELDELLPPGWFSKKANGTYAGLNGTTIRIRSAKYPQKLKRGRCDYAFLNEAQNVKRRAFEMLWMRCSDTSGLVFCAANPPDDNPDGEWVAEERNETLAGRRENSVCFELSHKENPHVSAEQLAALAASMDPRSYAIEVGGEVLPPSNAVMHAFSPVHNIATAPDAPDVTEAFSLARGLGAGITDLVGLDFQRTPHMAGVQARCYRNPDNESMPSLNYRREFLVALGDEYDLSMALYAAGLDPATTALIADASGAFQGADRKRKVTSFQILRDEGWSRIFVPDPGADRNPPVLERMKNDNRLFFTKAGVHQVTIDPACVALIECCKKWRRLNGVPSRHSKHAHIGDAMSYVNFRLFPRVLRRGKIEYKSLRKFSRRQKMRGW